MNKYIDRCALFNSLSNAKTVEEIFAAIQAAPAEDVEPVRRGRWELVDEAEPRRYGCSVCKRLSWYESNYCPNCGARMEE